MPEIEFAGVDLVVLAVPCASLPAAVEPLIPAKNRGIILYSVRDRITFAPGLSAATIALTGPASA